MTKQMAIDFLLGLIPAILFCMTVGIVSYDSGQKSVPTKAEVLSNLTHDERQAIAVQFMCAERQWKGVETFCGSQVFDSSGRVK